MRQRSNTRARALSQAKTAAFDAVPAQVALIDPTGVVLTVNEAWSNYARGNALSIGGFGVGENYLESYQSAHATRSAQATEVANGIQGVLLGELQEFAIDYAALFPTNPRWFRIMVTPIARSLSYGAVVMHLDISFQKTLEQRLRDQEAQYLRLLDSTKEGILVLEARGVCTFCNHAGARLLGYETPADVVGRVVHHRHHHSRPDLTPHSFNESKIGQTLTSGNMSHVTDEIFFRVDGSQFPVEYWSHPIYSDLDVVGTVVTFFDITEQTRLMSEFMHAQKMEVVGRLAGGAAHDFKNALAVIAGYSQLLGERLAMDENGRRYARQISLAAERAASFTRQLLGFNRKQPLKPVPLDLSAVVLGLEDSLRRMVGEHITLTLRLASNLPVIRADLGQIEQILINLIVNARDAMPGGGELAIETSMLNAAGYITLNVSDCGSGMDQATQDRIFEPFFTTKGPGKGTGLGLSTVQEIVKQSGGHIFVHSELGVGTSLQIYLPIVEGVPGPVLLAEVPQRAFRGAETILVIEDEEALRMLISDTLRTNGYKVVEAENGTTGIELAERYAGQIDLVLTDVVLPDVDGGRVADRLREFNRSLEVLYMSGYTDDYIASLGIEVRDTPLLEKPFDLEFMLMAVRKALDGRRANTESKGLLSPHASSPGLRVATGSGD